MKNISKEEQRSLDATWNALPDFSTYSDSLAIIDTSGSMYCDGKPLPAAVALSLGLYFAEHNKGAFRNHFIEFSSSPKLIEIKGESFYERLRYICSFNTIADTNIEAVFDLILNTAVKNKLPSSSLPERLIIISDMEFNCCVNNAGETNFINAKRKFEKKGYILPKVVFWNVASRTRTQPVKENEEGVILVSGCSPVLFGKVADGSLDSNTPYEFMLQVLSGERYERISA